MARDPTHRRGFEKLLYLAAKRGDADRVEERLAWGIDPNCDFDKGTTPMLANIRGYSPSARTVTALLKRPNRNDGNRGDTSSDPGHSDIPVP